MPDLKSPPRDAEDQENWDESPEEDAPPRRGGVPPIAILGLVIIGLLGALVAMMLKGGSVRSTDDDSRLVEMKAELNARRSELNQQRIAAGLPPIEGGSESVSEISGRIKKDTDALVALSGSFQRLLDEKEADLTARSEKLLSSEKLRQSLYAENSRIQSELNRALIGGADSADLRKELAALQQRLLAQSKGVSEEEYADLKRRFDETLKAKEFFEAQVRELEGRAITPTKLFASSENELLPAAVELFRSLRELENSPDSEISSAYSSLAIKLGADVMKTLNFATGSSTMAAADESALQTLISEVPDGDLILAIGYASETGNVDSNRVLSSDRATAAAQFVNSVKRPGQATQAVYLGQTDRFSSRIPERNQLVEIWHIRKK